MRDLDRRLHWRDFQLCRGSGRHPGRGGDDGRRLSLAYVRRQPGTGRERQGLHRLGPVRFGAGAFFLYPAQFRQSGFDQAKTDPGLQNRGNSELLRGKHRPF